MVSAETLSKSPGIVRQTSSCSTCSTADLESMRDVTREATECITQMLDDELRWLRTMIKRTPAKVRQALVSHSGFHHVDNAVCRPLENSISAFTQAWANGITYCQCDVTLLSDGHMVLNADNCLARLTSDSPCEELNTKHLDLSTMTLGAVLRTQLKNGLSATLLTNVVDHAKALQGKLIVNLKPGCASTSALINLFSEDPDTLDCVRVITSSDGDLLKNFLKLYQSRMLPQDLRPTVMLRTYASGENGDLELTLSVFPRVRAMLGEIDGVYIECSAELLRQRLLFKQLCSETMVGVWQKSVCSYGNYDQPDNVWVAEQLVTDGAVFVNTDFPYTFTDNRTRGKHL